jgi:hypothetical protein
MFTDTMQSSDPPSAGKGNIKIDIYSDQDMRDEFYGEIASGLKSCCEDFNPEEYSTFYDDNSLMIGDRLADALIAQLKPFHSLQNADIFHILHLDPDSEELKYYLADNADIELWKTCRQEFLDQVNRDPEWLDWEQLERGQIFFWKHFFLILPGLFYASLLQGFIFPRLSSVLVKTGYLANEKLINRRLMETFYFVLCVSKLGVLQSGVEGESMKAIIRVRFMHASVRRRLHEKKSRNSACPFSGTSAPGTATTAAPAMCPYATAISPPPRHPREEYINQMDMAAVALSFQIAVMIFIVGKCGITLNQQEMEDYTHFWRYISYLLGVEDSYNPCQSLHQSSQFLFNYLNRNEDGSQPHGKKLAKALISGMTIKPFTYTDNLDLAYVFCFPALLDYLGFEMPAKSRVSSRIEASIHRTHQRWQAILNSPFGLIAIWIVSQLVTIFISYQGCDLEYKLARRYKRKKKSSFWPF